VSRFAGCDTPEVFERLREGRFDACIVSGWYLKSYLQAVMACKRVGIPVCSRGDSHLATGRPALWSLAKYLPYRALLASFDAHLYVGQANREYLEHYGVARERLFFAPHFVDNDFFATRAAAARSARPSARMHLEIPESARVFTFVGKLIDIKRPQDLVRALAAVRSSGLDAWGLIVGAGPLQGEVESLARTLNVPVRFTGFRNQTEIPAVLAAADGLVLCSQSETWGLVVNEAMACGLPAIVSRTVGCAPDLIVPGRTGYVFDTGSVDALAAAMRTLAADLERDRGGVNTAVLETISRYSCQRAVRGALDALDSLQTSTAPARAGWLRAR